MVYQKLFGDTIEECFGGEKEGLGKRIGFIGQVIGIGSVTAPCNGPPDIGKVQRNEIGMGTWHIG